MSFAQTDVSTASELLAAAADPEVRRISVVADVQEVPSLRLSPGQTLTGLNPQVAVHFASGNHGLQVSADNRVEGLQLFADPEKRVLFNDTNVDRLGRLVLRNLRVTGVVELLAADRVRSGHVEGYDIDVVAADARSSQIRPKGYGVEVIPGAFTLWNQQADSQVRITAELAGISAGRPGAPVRGSGIFVSGAGDSGGWLIASRLETGAVYSDGGIAPRTPDRISAGVFIVHGAFVDNVRIAGPVTTYGPNDMALDNWGTVDRWLVDAKVTSHGPSAIGFVNFGSIERLEVTAPIETFGQGARGFNVYTGTVRSAEFDRLVTHGDGAVGIQISQPVGGIKVRRGIETYGGSGESLVKGVLVNLSAIALSVKPGGSVQKLEVAGGLITHGLAVEPLELHGTIQSIQLDGSLASAGGGFGHR